MFTVVNSSSPLRLDAPMLQGMIEFASRNQVVVMTPFTLSGAMAPITLAGAVAQQNAEALAGMVFTQVVRPGAPVVYGGFTSNVDMQSGAPAFGTPEYVRTAMLGGQLARRYAVPYRSSNVSRLQRPRRPGRVRERVLVVGRGHGRRQLPDARRRLDGGRAVTRRRPSSSLDADLLGMVAAFLEPIVVDEDTLAVDAIREVGPGGHFFGIGHTQERFRTAFHRPMVSDWRNYETWAEAGRPEAGGQGDAARPRLPRRLRAAADGPGRARGARRLRRPPRRRGRRARRITRR